MFTSFRTEKQASTGRVQKSRRSQVQQACEACRQSRVRCDAVRPCRKCVQSNRDCVDRTTKRGGKNQNTSRIHDTIPRESLPAASVDPPLMTPPQTESKTASPASLSIGSPAVWKGISLRGVEYGPLSVNYFVHRMSTFLDMDMEPATPLTSVFHGQPDDCTKMSPAMQDTFIDLYWLGYHVNYPILDESAFRQLHASVRSRELEGSLEQPDPLIDIVLALSIQYANCFQSRGGDSRAIMIPPEDAASAGRPFFQRSNVALQASMETPSLKYIQCQFLSAVYLSCAGCSNAAHTTIKMAEHTLSTLSVERDDAVFDLSIGPEEIVSRIRRCLRTVDIKLAMRLGRLPDTPRTLFQHDDTAGLVEPEDDQPDWFTFHKHMLRLCEVAEEVAVNSSRRCSELIQAHGGNNEADFHSNLAIRGGFASVLRLEMKKLRDCVAQVPPALRLKRKASLSSSDVGAFSTRRTEIHLDDGVPAWLHRQRLLLECQYHDFCTMLLRTMFSFSPTPTEGTLDTDSGCISAVDHAVALTRILHQTQTETDLLAGCYQAFEWQQNSAYTLMGFAAAYPVCPPTPICRKCLSMAAEVFELYGPLSLAADTMRRELRDVNVKIRSIAVGLLGGDPQTTTPSQGTGRSQPTGNTGDANIFAGLRAGANPAENEKASFLQPMGFVDNTGAIGDLWTNMGTSITGGEEQDPYSLFLDDMGGRALGDSFATPAGLSSSWPNLDPY